MNKEILKEIIISNKEFINSIPDIVERNIMKFDNNLKKVIILYGARRTGKSYILYNILNKNFDRCLYVDFEDERLTDFKTEDFQILYESFFELYIELIDEKEKVYFLFDEIQNVAGWEKFVRRISEKEFINVVITGSSSKLMPLEINTALRGRALSIPVYPLSFNEYLKIKKSEAFNKKIYGKNKILIKNHFEKYLKYGAFPEIAVMENEYMIKKVLKEYMDAMYFKDLVEHFKISNIALLDTLREILFSSYGLKCSLTSIYNKYKNSISFSKDTLYLYYKYFIESMLIYEVPYLSESYIKRKNQPKKMYILDNGLNKKILSENYGRLLENLIFIQLLRLEYEVYFLSNGFECDFVFKTNNKWNVIQVCRNINDSNKSREYSGILKACKFFKINEALIITEEQEYDEGFEKIKIKVMPAYKWLLLNV